MLVLGLTEEPLLAATTVSLPALEELPLQGALTHGPLCTCGVLPNVSSQSRESSDREAWVLGPLRMKHTSCVLAALFKEQRHGPLMGQVCLNTWDCCPMPAWKGLVDPAPDSAGPSCHPHGNIEGLFLKVYVVQGPLESESFRWSDGVRLGSGKGHLYPVGSRRLLCSQSGR